MSTSACVSLSKTLVILSLFACLLTYEGYRNNDLAKTNLIVEGSRDHVRRQVPWRHQSTLWRFRLDAAITASPIVRRSRDDVRGDYLPWRNGDTYWRVRYRCAERYRAFFHTYHITVSWIGVYFLTFSVVIVVFYCFMHFIKWLYLLSVIVYCLHIVKCVRLTYINKRLLTYLLLSLEFSTLWNYRVIYTLCS